MRNETGVRLGLLCLSAASLCHFGCTIQTVTDQSDGGEPKRADASGASNQPIPDATAGADTGTGDAGAGGPAEAGALASDPCGPTETANDDRDHATPYVLGADFHGCFQARDDVDFYRITIPATPVQGGVVVVQVKDVDASGDVDLLVQGITDDTSAIHNVWSYTMGQSQALWFNAAPGVSYLVRVKPFSVATETAYTLRMDFTGVQDMNELNDDRATATPITVGTPVHGYLFSAPITAASTNGKATPWDDWYKVTLPAGNTTFALTDVATDANAQLWIYDTSDAGALSNPYSYTNGSDVSATKQVAAGDYYVVVQPFSGVATSGGGTTPPLYTTKPYTLTVSQQ